MSIQNKHPLTEKLQLLTDSSGVALSIAGLFIPALLPIVPFVNLASLSLNALNQDCLQKRIAHLEDIINENEIKSTHFSDISKEEIELLSLNTAAFLENALKEKMDLKLRLLARVYVDGINSGEAFKMDDQMDIRMDIIRSLRMEDIDLLGHLARLLQAGEETSSTKEVSLKELDESLRREHKDINHYALRHLVALGLLEERMEAVVGNVIGSTLELSNQIQFTYSLSSRFSAIRDVILSSNRD